MGQKSSFCPIVTQTEKPWCQRRFQGLEGEMCCCCCCSGPPGISCAPSLLRNEQQTRSSRAVSFTKREGGAGARAAGRGAADGGSTSLVVAVLSASAENSLGSVSNSVLFVFGNNTVGHLLNQKRVGPVMDGGK